MIEALSSLPAWLVLSVVGLVIAAESGFIAGLVLPGTTAVLAIGVLIGLGVVPMAPAYAVAFAAGVAGPSIAWRVGRSGGPALRTSRLGSFVGEPRWRIADRVVDRRGPTAVVFAQFIVGARTLVPLVVGTSEMPYRRFARASIPAAAVWALGLTFAGQLAGASYEVLVDELGATGVLVAVTVASVAGLGWLGRLLAQHPEWVPEPSRRTRPHIFHRAQFAVDTSTHRRIGPGWGPAVAAVVWWVAAVAAGMVITAGLVWATSQSPLRRVDSIVAAWIADQSSSGMVTAGEHYATAFDPRNFLCVAYVITAVVVHRYRDQLGRARSSRLVIAVVGLAALAFSTQAVSDIMRHRATGTDAFEFENQLAIGPCLLGLAIILASPWLSRQVRTAAWAVAVVLVALLVASAAVTGTTISEIAVALTVGIAWTVMLAASARPGPQLQPAVL